MKLAIFGGTFDPIHAGHLAAAREASTRFALDRVLFIPAAHPPHKAGVTHAPYDDRVRMAELACRDDARFEVSRLEEGTARSYSIDTIEKVRAMLAPGDGLYFLIGADAFAEIRTWRRWTDVARAVRFLVVSRPGHTYEIPAEVTVDRIDSLEIPISSSEIRRTLAAGGIPEGLPPAVLAYARDHHLYN
uniref:Probable nicotinate-nucleotide adenylyltransferase n=1 Tax=Solibacter usitatus (strain Ellin6076) TaxID=234267 RepID=NADD_SOLUE|nr:RecName: Full=Probable nicotinate-nucleotide adenylyltransferase; AltName: Full=Deamido-NAD(+) diphosphorylase; AltName: Full=Deamido-NAD(+) pyrophosphorylase; AltName: Full=Nicotinate mononucleotide adenylyltransferase; Short=NaMN adenylyltransferase [Candidatus Solibacter usitatus Ellin6076]